MKRKFIINKTFSINSAEDFRDYAHNLMKQAHGDEYSEEATNKVVDDLLNDNPTADYGELIGRLTSGFGQKEFAGTSDHMKVLEDRLKKRKKYYDDLKKSLKDSTSEFDKARLELANNSVLEAQAYIQMQKIKEEYEKEMAKQGEIIEKLRMQWQELYEKVANAE